MKRTLLILACVGLHAPVPALAEEAADGEVMSAPLLRHNPFAPPALTQNLRPASSSPIVQATPSWTPELRATVVAGPQSLVNVGGVILSVGEALDGYQLIEIRERAAVFERDGKRRVLTME